MRADQLLVERGLAVTRSKAQRLIAAGVQWFDGAAWKRVAKNGDELPSAARLELLDTAESRYVSRGGLKLEGALQTAGLDVAGWTCLDVGQSTGGFTDCLLQRGAKHVTGVDVGHGQLHPKLRGRWQLVAVLGHALPGRTVEPLHAGGDEPLRLRPGGSEAAFDEQLIGAHALNSDTCPACTARSSSRRCTPPALRSAR